MKQRVELKGEVVAVKSHYRDIASGFADYRCLFHSDTLWARCTNCSLPNSIDVSRWCYEIAAVSLSSVQSFRELRERDT